MPRKFLPLNYIIFKHKRRQINFVPRTKINGKRLLPSNFIKYPGIYIDE